MSDLCVKHGTGLMPEDCPYCEIDTLKADIVDHQFQNDCHSGSDVCACSEKNGYPCYRHIDHEYRKLFALNTLTIDRAETAEAERDALMKVCEDETGAIKKITEERDRLRGALEIIITNSLNPVRTMTKLGLEEVTDANHKVANQALNHNEPLPAHPGCKEESEEG